MATINYDFSILQRVIKAGYIILKQVIKTGYITEIDPFTIDLGGVATVVQPVDFDLVDYVAVMTAGVAWQSAPGQIYLLTTMSKTEVAALVSPFADITAIGGGSYTLMIDTAAQKYLPLKCQ